MLLWIYCLLNINRAWFQSLHSLGCHPTNEGEVVSEAWWSVKVQACFALLCVLGAFLLNNGAWVRLNTLPPTLVRAIPDLVAPKQNMNPSMSYSRISGGQVVWAQHTECWWGERFGSCKSRRKTCLLHNAKPGSTTAWGYFSISFFSLRSEVGFLPHFISRYFW